HFATQPYGCVRACDAFPSSWPPIRKQSTHPYSRPFRTLARNGLVRSVPTFPPWRLPANHAPAGGEPAKFRIARDPLGISGGSSPSRTFRDSRGSIGIIETAR